MATPSLSEQLGLLIKETQSALHQRMDEALRPLRLSVAQYACLQALHDQPGITGSELARRVFVTRQSMNVLLQGLATRGMVARAERPGPRRERATVLTPTAEAMLADARAAVAEVADVLTGGIADADRMRLLGLLRICRDNLRGVDGPGQAAV